MSKIDTNNILEDNTTINCKKVYVYCKGLKKRCRSVNRHNLNLGYFTPDTQDAEYIEEARKALAAMMLMVYLPAEISITNHQIELRNGMRIERFSSTDIFEARKIEVNQ